MPRRERDRELARRRKRREKRRKLRAKGLLPPVDQVKTESIKETGTKRPERVSQKESNQEASKDTPEVKTS
jgi:hypothetical protein